MLYLTETNEIKQTIDKLTNYPILWLDTEIADWDKPQLKRLSLLQVLANPNDTTGNHVYLLDLLDKQDLIVYFIDKIMVNKAIEKVFHNAPFDIKFLGGKEKVNNITCTLNLANKLSLEKLGTPNRKLKTLASYLCNYSVVEYEQKSDWGKRPLTDNQVQYAIMDVIFLNQVHRELLFKLGNLNKINIYQTVIDFLRLKKLDFTSNQEASVISVPISLTKRNWLLVIFCDEVKQQITFSSLVPVIINLPASGTINSALQKINQQIFHSHFIFREDINKIILESVIIHVFKPINHRSLLELLKTHLQLMIKYLDKIGTLTQGNTKINQKFHGLETFLELKPVTETLDKEYQPVFAKKKTLPKSNSLTVDNIKLGLECPRLLYLVYHQGGESHFYLDSESSQLTVQFNHLITKLASNLQNNKGFTSLFSATEDLDIATIIHQIKHKFYEIEIYPYIILPLTETKTKPESDKVNGLLTLWALFQDLVKIWVEVLLSNKNHLQGNQLINQSFINSQTIESIINYQTYSQTLTATIPNLVYDLDAKNLVFIQPNTLPFIDLEIKKAQISLLTYILTVNNNLKIEQITYWLLNSETSSQKLIYSISEIESFFTDISTNKIPQFQQWLTWQPSNQNPPPKTDYPQLCNICPQKTKCQTLFESVDSQAASLNSQAASIISDSSSTDSQITSVDSKSNSLDFDFSLTNSPWEESNYPSTDSQAASLNSQLFIKLPPPPPIQSPPSIGDKIGKELISVFDAFNASVGYHGAIVAPSFVRVKVKPHKGVSFHKIKKLSEDLQIQMGFDTPPLIQSQAGYVSIDTPRKDRQTAFFEQYLSYSPDIHKSPTHEFKIALGIDIDGRLIETDLSDSDTCHFLIGGTTGSGKSEFLRSILLSLLIRHSPHYLQIVLVDPKRVTFPEFETMPWLLKPIIKDEESAINLMEELVTEMENRFKKLDQSKCNDSNHYNQKFADSETKQMPRIVCIFDKYADFMAEKSTRDILEQNIKRLGAKARASGINLIIATQRPSANVVTPLIRANLPGRIALKTATEADSDIILGIKKNKANAAYLLGKGDLLYLKNGQLNRLQSLLLHDFSLPS